MITFSRKFDIITFPHVNPMGNSGVNYPKVGYLYLKRTTPAGRSPARDEMLKVSPLYLFPFSRLSR